MLIFYIFEVAGKNVSTFLFHFFVCWTEALYENYKAKSIISKIQRQRHDKRISYIISLHIILTFCSLIWNLYQDFKRWLFSNLTQLDFYLKGWIRALVYVKRLLNKHYLCARITDAFTHHELKTVSRNNLRRPQFFRESNGWRFKTAA